MEVNHPNGNHKTTEAGPLVSVLLCTYNNEAFIQEAIDSILAQSYRNFEFLIVNDGSTDKTKQLILSYKDPRIRYLEHPENKGLEDSKNWGLAEAKGKYIAYIDGDDIALPERLEVLKSFMETNPDVGLCASAVEVFGDKTNIYHPAETDFEIRARALVGTPLPHPSCMIRAETLRKHGIRYRKDFPAAEDYPFMLDFLKVSKAYCFPSPLLRYRRHSDSVSVTNNAVQQESARRATDMAFMELVGIEVSEEERRAYSRFWRKTSVPEDINILRRITARIALGPNLEEGDREFRLYFKKILTDEIIDSLLEKNRRTDDDLKNIRHSLSWKLTSPLRIIGNLIKGEKKQKLDL